MVLKSNRLFHRMSMVLRRALRPGRTFDLNVILNENPILQNRDRARFEQLALGIKTRRMINDIIRLPFPGFAAGVD